MDTQQLQHARDQVLKIYEAGVSRVKGFNATSYFLRNQLLTGEYHLIGVGKAASSMSLGAISVLGNKIIDGLVITKHDHTDDELRAHKNIIIMEIRPPSTG